jgi:hypothetical protein
MACDTGEANLPRPQFDEEQHIQRGEANSLHGEEVRGEDARGLRPQKPSPGDRRPAGRRPKPAAKQDRSDGGGRHTDVELLELTLDAPVAPARVLTGQPKDQRYQVLGQRWTAASRGGLGPLAGDQAPVPPQDRAWRHQEDRPV